MVEGKAPGRAQEFVDSGVSRFELMRSLTGRRSVEQMKQLGLDGEQIKLLLQGTPLRVPTTAIEI
jgi:hypothetical protein